MSENYCVPMKYLPEGAIVVGHIMITKCLDSEGHVFLHYEKSSDLAAWEALGMATTTCDSLRVRLIESEDDEDD